MKSNPKHIPVGEIWDRKWGGLDIDEFKQISFSEDNWTLSHKTIIEKYLKDVGAGGVFLEAGCGMGHWCFHASEKYKIRSVGVDIAEKTISRLGDYCAKNELLNFKVDDLNNSKLESDYFDMFVSLGVIEHFKNHRPMMNNLNRILKPGGIGIITTPNIYSLHTFTRPILQFMGKWDIGYEKSFSPKQLSRISEDGGFKILGRGVLPSGELFGCFLNNLPVIGKFFKKASLLIEKRQNIVGFISFVVVQKNND